MINFRVSDIENFREQMIANGVKMVSEIDTYDYGKFLHIGDPEGNKIELWEPVDEIFSGDRTAIMPMR